MIVASGLDWLMLDGEDASVRPAEMAAMVSAVGGRVPCNARVCALDAEAVAAIESACRAANIPVGIFGMTPDRVRPFADRGFEWLLTGINRPA